MKKFHLSLITAAVLALPFATIAQSDGHGDNPFAGHLAARQGQMQIMVFNISIVGGMARGNIDYDAAAAQTAADNLAVLAMLDGRGHWPAGSGNDAIAEGTRALPAIWEDMGAFGAAWGGYGDAVTNFQGVAGQGLDALRAGIGPLGTACGDCHRAFRQSDN